MGEERLTIEWWHEDDTVWYDILAFYRPRHWLVRAASPALRRLQRRFARDTATVLMEELSHRTS